MEKLSVIKRFLDKELRIKGVKDYSRNGLQVKCKLNVKKVGFAVDGCLSTFEIAKKRKIDLLIVHHGIKWKKDKFRGLAKKREGFLKKNKISLYGVHLPLDLHHKYGNNIGLSWILDLVNIKKFGKYHGFKIGYKGDFEKIIDINGVVKVLNRKLDTKCKVFSFGKKNIKNIGIISGGGSDAIDDAVKENLDCFLTGEINLNSYNRAKDYGLSLVVGGHYATETVGVKALMELIKEKFNVEAVFIENKTEI